MKSGSGSRLVALLISLGLVGSALFFLALTVSGAFSRVPGLIIITLMGEALVYGALMFGPVGRALGRMLEGDGGGQDLDGRILDRLADIEDRLVDISGEVARVADMESRIEFAERLLARPNEFGKDGT